MEATAVDEPATWSVSAINLPEHANNAIHTDAGARAAGFSGALVAGVTTYAYLTHRPRADVWCNHSNRFRSNDCTRTRCAPLVQSQRPLPNE